MGLLLNVDYNDPLARARAKKVLQLAGSGSVEEAIDAYYIHYRVPIFGGKASSPVWERFVRIYVVSPYYAKIAPLCRLRHAASLRAAVNLLKAFSGYLHSLDSFGSAWFGRGRQHAWAEAQRQLRRHFGDPSDLDMLYHIFKKLGEILGEGRVGDPASLALSLSADPRRVKMAEVLAKALNFYKLMGKAAELGFTVASSRGLERERVFSSLNRAAKLSVYARSLLVGAPPVFLHKAATGELPLDVARAAGNSGIYLLIDKSGSMYGVVSGVQKIVVATAYVIAVLKRYRKVVTRFFDAEVYEPFKAVDKLIDLLLRAVASGGTDISKAIEAAVRDAERWRLNNYTLVVVTDAEDEKLDLRVVERAKRLFREVVFALVGPAKPPQGVRAIRLPVLLGKEAPVSSLRLSQRAR